MAVRKVVLRQAPARPELDRLLEHARTNPVTDEQLREQRVSFAYGNAPTSSRSTKDLVRRASETLRLFPRD